MERLSTSHKALAVRGQLRIHSAPSALRSHIDWAIQDLLGTRVRCEWTPQMLKAGTYKCVLAWRDRVGASAEIASVLRSWHYLSFEVQEDGIDGGEIFRFTPELGIHRAMTDLAGAVIISENQIDLVLKTNFDEDSIRKGLALIIGSAWENELERFRGVDHQEVAHLRAI